MSSDKPTKKPTPTVAEINAYLDESAARTRKRLPLALGKPAPKPLASLPTKGAKLQIQSATPLAGSDSEGEEKQWQPFSAESPTPEKPDRGND